MVQVKFSARLVLDSDFFIWLANSDLQPLKKREALRNLMYIKASSLDCKKERDHNIILESEFNKIIDSNIIISDSNLDDSQKLKQFIKSISDPDFLQNFDPITKTILFAIDSTKEEPFESIILTAPHIKNDYLGNSHLKEIKRVSVKCGNEALDLLEVYFKEIIALKELRY
jgi:hypothetical protein